MPVTLTCANCGKQYSVPPSRAKNTKTHFCSQSCMSQFNKGDRNPNWKGGLAISFCRNCGTEIQTKPSHVKNGAGVYCSRACQAAWKHKTALGYDPKLRIKKQCQTCGKDIFVKPSHADKAGAYCSRECMAVGYHTQLKGESNPNYRHGQAGTLLWLRAHRAKAMAKRKNAVGSHTAGDIAYLLRQQRGACALCQCSIAHEYHIDHRIPLSRGGHNGIGNLQLLCPDYNRRKHARFLVELKYGKKRRHK